MVLEAGERVGGILTCAEGEPTRFAGAFACEGKTVKSEVTQERAATSSDGKTE